MEIIHVKKKRIEEKYFKRFLRITHKHATTIKQLDYQRTGSLNLLSFTLLKQLFLYHTNHAATTGVSKTSTDLSSNYRSKAHFDGTLGAIDSKQHDFNVTPQFFQFCFKENSCCKILRS